jgi:hypothetical protein
MAIELRTAKVVDAVRGITRLRCLANQPGLDRALNCLTEAIRDRRLALENVRAHLREGCDGFQRSALADTEYRLRHCADIAAEVLTDAELPALGDEILRAVREDLQYLWPVSVRAKGFAVVVTYTDGSTEKWTGGWLPYEKSLARECVKAAFPELSKDAGEREFAKKRKGVI